jgi:hypothetical protein
VPETQRRTRTRATPEALAALPPDLAERVQSDDDPITLREAKHVMVLRERRVDVWAL